MDGQSLIYALIGITILFLVIKFLKWPLKIIINGVIGVIILYATNFIMSYLNLMDIDAKFSLPINPITALIAGFFGIPGVIALIIIRLFL